MKDRKRGGLAERVVKPIETQALFTTFTSPRSFCVRSSFLGSRDSFFAPDVQELLDRVAEVA